MVTKATDEWHGCPIRYGSVVLGDVWNLIILRDIIFKGHKYYGDFLSAGEGISTNILAARLCRLEAEGVVSKTRDAEHGSKFVYALTEKGKGLVPVLLEIFDWSEKWDPRTEVPKDYIRAVRADRAGVAKRIIDKM